jgi:transcriptional regulator with XRE-family HTH domain
MNKELMAERISQEIERKHILKKDLGAVIGSSDVMISYWCNGKRVPLLHQIVGMAEYFGVTVDYLIGMSDVPHRAPTLADELGLSERATANIKSLSATADGRKQLNGLLEQSNLPSIISTLNRLKQLFQ